MSPLITRTTAEMIEGRRNGVGASAPRIAQRNPWMEATRGLKPYNVRQAFAGTSEAE